MTDEETHFMQRVEEQIRTVSDGRHLFSWLMHSLAQSTVWRRVFLRILRINRLFPSAEDTGYFLKFAFKYDSCDVLELLEENDPKIHEFIFEDGKSALYYFAESDGSWERSKSCPRTIMILVKAFLDKLPKNFIDTHGYSYLHAACRANDAEAIRQCINEGVNVNLNTYKFTPLHIAVQQRRKDIMQILLDNGADVSQLDLEQSTPLHALGRLNLCRCVVNRINFCDYREAPDEIVDILMKKNVNIEARDNQGDTALQMAVANFDVELTRSLLAHGASLESLNAEKIFNCHLKPVELKKYPLTLNIIDTVRELQSAGYRLNLETRLRMMKFWVQARGNDTDHLIFTCSDPIDEDDVYLALCDNLHVIYRFGFFMKKEGLDYLEEEKKKLRVRWQNVLDEPTEPETIDELELEIVALDGIEVKENFSLYQLCKLSYEKAYRIVKNLKNWRLPSMSVLDHGDLHMIVKRHMANVMIRPLLELLVADLFMSDHCKLNLPHTACWNIAEHMSDEELFRLVDQTNEEDILDPQPAFKKQRLRVE